MKNQDYKTSYDYVQSVAKERYFHIMEASAESYGRRGTVYFRNQGSHWICGVSLVHPKDNFSRASGRAASRRHCLIAWQQEGANCVTGQPTRDAALHLIREYVREVLPQVAEAYSE